MADTPAAATEPAGQTLPGRPAEEPPDADVLVEDLLVEEVSIDGMCGVY
jgi:mycofactocin precursor